jgi:hypothetical protein
MTSIFLFRTKFGDGRATGLSRDIVSEWRMPATLPDDAASVWCCNEQQRT